MDYDELLKLAEYCLKIEDIPSLFIISHLLVNFHLGTYENKITIYRSFRNLVVLKIYAGKVGPDPRHLEEMFNTSFSILLKKKIICVTESRVKNKPKGYLILFRLCGEIEKGQGRGGHEYDVGKKEKILDVCFRGFDFKRMKIPESVVSDDAREDIRNSKDFPDHLGVDEHQIRKFLTSRDRDKWMVQEMNLQMQKETQRSIAVLKVKKAEKNLDPKEQARLNAELEMLQKRLAVINKKAVSNKPSARPVISKPSRPTRPMQRKLDSSSNLTDKIIAEATPIQKNKMAIKAMIDQVELQLRELLIWKFPNDTSWIKKEFVPSDVIQGKFGKDGLIDKKSNETLRLGGKILDPASAFLNACSFGELISIILHKPDIFVDVFDEKNDPGAKGKPLAKTKIYLDELKIIRNLSGHTDQSVSWNDDMVANARTFANKILLPIIAWRER